MKKLTTKEFIQKAKKKHGNYYDYSKSIYLTAKKPITVICPVHGEFRQLAANHMHRSGCIECAREKMVTPIDHFIDVCSKVHNNKYGYDNVIITNLNNFVKITCPDHGEFLQRPTGHMAGHGCRKCSGYEKLNTEEFIRKANIKHNSMYTYGNSDCVNGKSMVQIICSIHGDFTQRVSDHLNGHGCQICAGTNKVTTEEFITRAKNVHGDLYEYNNSDIIGMGKKITITCPIHGDFDQRAADHLNGCACPKCSLEFKGIYNETYFKNNPDKKILPAIFYVVDSHINDIKFCKIGVTIETVKQRFSGKCAIDDKIEVKTKLYDAWLLEHTILKQLKAARWRYKNLRSINFHGWTECFSMNLKKDIVNIIEQYQQ